MILLLGSNINPERNINTALDLLGKSISKSRLWKTESFGTDGPDFLNIAVGIETVFDNQEFKEKVINKIEKDLKRIRTTDKYAPRTIDIDIIIFNGKVLDDDLWEKGFIAIPVSELRPDKINPDNCLSLKEHARLLKSSANAELYVSEK